MLEAKIVGSGRCLLEIVLDMSIEDRLSVFLHLQSVRELHLDAMPLEILGDYLEDLGLSREFAKPTSIDMTIDEALIWLPLFVLVSNHHKVGIWDRWPYQIGNRNQLCCWSDYTERDEDIEYETNPDGDHSALPSVWIRYMVFGAKDPVDVGMNVRFSDPDKARAALSDAILRWSLDKCRQVYLGMDMVC